jgi:hypothetical protein
MRRFVPAISICAALLVLAPPNAAQPFDLALYPGMGWRMIVPFRGGRTVAATGIPRQPSVFYVGVNNAGVWRSTDFGHVWKKTQTEGNRG